MFSLLLSIKSWVSYTLSTDEHRNLDQHLLMNVVDLERQYNLVLGALQNPDRSVLLLKWSQQNEIEGWACDLADIEPGTRVISHLVQDKELLVPECMAYFCFNGAFVIDYLWRMKVPSLVEPPVGYSDRFNDKFENIVLEQLKNLYGVYHFNFDDNNYEGHGYVWYMRKDTITVMNTYGGVVGFLWKHLLEMNTCPSLLIFIHTP